MKFERVNDIVPLESRILSCQLQPHDVITIIPPYGTKKKLKLFEKLPLWNVLDDISNFESWTADVLRKNAASCMSQVIQVDYKKFPWWQFWKKNKYIEKYYIEIV